MLSTAPWSEAEFLALSEYAVGAKSADGFF